MNHQSQLYAAPDRTDCIRADECRSPYLCDMANRCVDALSGAEERRLLTPDRAFVKNPRKPRHG